MSKLTSQAESQKAIVLINGSPYLVDVTEKGNILTIYQEVQNFFTSSASPKSLLASASANAVKQSGGFVFFENEEEPVPSFSVENEQPITYGNDQYIGFSPERALLLKKAVDQIRRISEAVGDGTIRQIKITSFHKDTFRSRSLARNRASAIKDLLGAFGVSNAIIDVVQNKGEEGTKFDFVEVSFSEY